MFIVLFILMHKILIYRRRCLVTAETRWYESIIKPSSKKTNEEISIENKDEDMEIIIEED